MNKEIKDKTLAAMALSFDLDASKISDKVSRENCSQWDSLNHLKLFMALEEGFNIQFTPEDIFELSSLEKIIEKLESYTQV